MKRILASVIFLLVTVMCNGQPNTVSTIKVGIVNPNPAKSYLIFTDVKLDSISGSSLVDSMDYLDPNISGLIKTLQDTYQEADTLWGYIYYPDETYPRFATGGIVQVDNSSIKYSGMLVSYWLELDSIEAMEAGFIFRRK